MHIVDLWTSIGGLRLEIFVEDEYLQSQIIAKKFLRLLENYEIEDYGITRFIPFFGLLLEKEATQLISSSLLNARENIGATEVESRKYGIVSDEDFESCTNTTNSKFQSRLHHIGAGVLSYIPFKVRSKHFDFTSDMLDPTFFITLSPQPKLDKDFVIFGRILDGMSLLSKLNEQQIDNAFYLNSPVKILRSVSHQFTDGASKIMQNTES